MTIIRAPITDPTKLIPGPPLASSPYAAQGVQFPGLNPDTNNPVYLKNTSLTCQDNGHFSFSFWAQNFNFPAILFDIDPLNTASPLFGMLGSLANPILQMTMDLALLSVGQFATSWISPVSDGNWHHYLGSFLTLRPGTSLGILYIDDKLQVAKTVINNGSFVGGYIAPCGGRQVFVGGDGTSGFGTQYSVSDVWIGPGVILLDRDGNNNFIPSIAGSDRRKFTRIITGPLLVPNNPLGFPLAPIIFTGSSSNFATNSLGFSGAFAIINSSPKAKLTDVAGPIFVTVPA